MCSDKRNYYFFSKFCVWINKLNFFHFSNFITSNTSTSHLLILSQTKTHPLLAFLPPNSINSQSQTSSIFLLSSHTFLPTPPLFPSPPPPNGPGPAQSPSSKPFSSSIVPSSTLSRAVSLAPSLTSASSPSTPSKPRCKPRAWHKFTKTPSTQSWKPSSLKASSASTAVCSWSSLAQPHCLASHAHRRERESRPPDWGNSRWESHVRERGSPPWKQTRILEFPFF